MREHDHWIPYLDDRVQKQTTAYFSKNKKRKKKKEKK